MNLSQWHSTATDNNTASPNGFPENMLPSGVNDSARELMAGVRRWYEDAQWLNFGDNPTFATTASFTLAGNKKDTYETGRRIKAYDATTLYGTISDSTYSSATRVNVTLDSGELSASLSSVAVGIISFSNSSISRANYTDYPGRFDPDGTAIAMPSGWNITPVGGSTFDITTNISTATSKAVFVSNGMSGGTVRNCLLLNISGNPLVFRVMTSTTSGISSSGSVSFIVKILP